MALAEPQLVDNRPSRWHSLITNHNSQFIIILPFLFLLFGFTQLSLLNGFRWPYLGALIIWSVCFGGTHTLLHQRLPSADQYILPAVSLLTAFGFLMTARLAPIFLPRQIIWLAISTTILLIITFVPRNLGWLRRYKYNWLVAGFVLLAATLVFGVNPSGFGARYWLGLGGVYFQPSEPLKILLVVFLAVYLGDHRRQMIEVAATINVSPFGLSLRLPHPAHFGPILLMWGFSLILLFWQGDLGAALLFFCTFLGMLYAAIGQRRYVLIGCGLLLVAGYLGYQQFSYVAVRVDGWLNPWADADGRYFQIVQSLLAFANGGWFGQGLGQGLPTAIPVVHTDFVFAAIGEEYGLLGALAVLLCFGIIVYSAFQIALQSRTHFQQLMAVGIGLMMGIQTFVIAAGTLKLIPLTGVTMPFVSYGGSSLLTSFIMIGLLLFLSSRITVH